MESVPTNSKAPPAPNDSANGVDSTRGWIAVAAGFVALLSAFSALYSFGAFVTPMSAELGATKAAFGGVFSIATFLFLSLGIVTGPLSDRIGPRYLFAAGALLIGGGLAGTSQLHSIDFAYLTFGLCVGLGAACVFVPSFSNVSQWFVRHRGKASGIVAAGVGVGTMIGAPMAVVVIEAHGWRDALVIMGLSSGVLIFVMALLVPKAPRAPAGSGGGWGGWQFLRNREYACLYTVAIGAGLTVFLPFVFLVPYAVQLGISAIQAAGLVFAIGVASTLARPLVGVVGDRLGALPALRLCVLLIMISYVIWYFSGSYASLMAIALVFGAGYGGQVALVPVVLVGFYGSERVGTVVGTYYTGVSLGSLAAGPLAGAIIGPSGQYHTMALVFWGLSLIGIIALTPLRPGPVALPAAAGRASR